MSRTPVTVSGTGSRPEAVGQPSGRRGARPGAVATVIIVATLLGIGLRLYQLSRPGYLLGVTEYDDGTDFGSAILLIHGYLPYRDFIMVQPPGITLLMAPVALADQGRWAPRGGWASARILTALAGAAAVALGGLLVRHRGPARRASLTCGILAVYPDSVQAAHTVLLEPWLVLFCLLGALAVFDGDRLARRRRRLVWGGVAFGVRRRDQGLGHPAGAGHPGAAPGRPAAAAGARLRRRGRGRVRGTGAARSPRWPRAPSTAA